MQNLHFTPVQNPVSGMSWGQRLSCTKRNLNNFPTIIHKYRNLRTQCGFLLQFKHPIKALLLADPALRSVDDINDDLTPSKPLLMSDLIMMSL